MTSRGLAIVDSEIRGPTRLVRARLLLDTGSAMTMIRPATLAVAGYDMTQPRSRVRIATVGGIVETPLFVINKIAAIEHEWDDIGVLSHPLPAGLPFTGLLGANFLRNRRLTIDFRAGVVNLE